MAKRILMLISGLDIGGRHGGAERFGLELACALARQKLGEVTLAVFWKTNSVNEQAWQTLVEKQGVQVIFCIPWRHKNDISAFLRGVRTLKDMLPGNWDIVHSHFQLGSLAALWLKKKNKAGFACRTAHIAREWGDGWLAAGLRRMINGWLYPRFMDAEAGVSAAVCTYLDSRPGCRKKAIFIPNGIPVLYPDMEMDIPVRSSGKAAIGFIGRLTPQKDLPTLLKAFASVKSTHPDLVLEIAGDGPLMSDLKKQCTELEISPSVQFLGTVPDARSVFQRWRLLILPSIYEGLPTAIFEAFSHGIPVIGSDIPGVRGLIKPGINGWLFPAGDAEALADTIKQAVEDPDYLRSMAPACRESIKEYSIDAIARQYDLMFYPR